MKLNKLVITKAKEPIYVISFNEQEFEDLRSAIDIATATAKKTHKDSPSFRKALDKIDLAFHRINSDVFNRMKQKGAHEAR